MFNILRYLITCFLTLNTIYIHSMHDFRQNTRNARRRKTLGIQRILTFFKENEWGILSSEEKKYKKLKD